MIPALLAAASLAGVRVTVIELSLNPSHGFGVDSDGSVYMARVEGEAVRVVRFVRDGRGLRQAFVYPGRFVGALELLPTKKGLVVVDYESWAVAMYGRSGRALWRTRTRYPNGARLDPKGNVWFFYNSGLVAWKTPDSSEVEPVLGPYGEEVAVKALVEIAPTADGGFYAANEIAQLFYYGRRAAPKLVAKKIPSPQMVASRLGGVLVYSGDETGQRILHLSATGKVRTLWTAPPAAVTIRHMSRTPDGRLVLAGARQGGGVAYVLDPEAGR